MQELVDKQTLAKMLGVRASTVDYLRRKGDIPSVRVGKHPRFVFDDVFKKLRDGKVL